MKLGAGGKGVAQRYHFTSGLAKACYPCCIILLENTEDLNSNDV